MTPNSNPVLSPPPSPPPPPSLLPPPSPSPSPNDNREIQKLKLVWQERNAIKITIKNKAQKKKMDRDIHRIKKKRKD